jgi:hypothetical protein
LSCAEDLYVPSVFPCWPSLEDDDVCEESVSTSDLFSYI